MPTNEDDPPQQPTTPMRRLIPLLALAIAIAPFACVVESDGGGGSGGGSSISATVLFPPNVSATDEHILTVRGVATGDIDGIEVGGFDAESSDGFSTWTADVPIDAPQQTFTVVAFRDGHTPSFSLDSFTITRDPLVGAKLDHIDMDPGWTTIYAYAKNPDLNAAASETWATLAIEPITGRTLVVSGWGVGSGPALTSTIRVITAASGTADVYLIDTAAESVIHVDVINGARTTIASPSIGAGPDLDNPKSALFVEDHERLYIFDDGLDAIVAVSVATGDRVVIASDAIGGGASLHGTKDIAYDPNREILYVSTPSQAGILSVNIESGARTLVSGSTTGSGPPISSVKDLEFDDALDRIIAFVPNGARLLTVDPATGTRVELQSFPWAAADDVTYNPISQKAWIHTEEELLMSYDLATGETQILHSFAFPGTGILVPTNGPMAYDSRRDSVLFFGKEEDSNTLRGLSFESGSEFSLEAYYPTTEPIPVGISFDDRRDHLLVLQPGPLGIYGLDLDDGAMTYISGPGNPGDPPAGTGSSFDDPTGITIGPGNRHAAIADGGSANGVIFVDLLTGDRSLSSSSMSGYGPIWSEPSSITASDGSATTWICDPEARIYSVDRETGGRTLIGDYSGIAGVTSLTRVLHDEKQDTLYALDESTGTILKVNPQTGLASIIFGPGTSNRGIHIIPSNWAMDTTRGTIIFATESPASLLIYDPQTRQSVLVAR
ncbi:MAG: hypothetical protein CL933_19100 [Deltaproteobacteria bacterium]|nr:hypothetical protein [Deltaproteobacteria bacterium]